MAGADALCVAHVEECRLPVRRRMPVWRGWLCAKEPIKPPQFPFGYHCPHLRQPEMRPSKLLAVSWIVCASPGWLVTPLSELYRFTAVRADDKPSGERRLVNASGVTALLNARPVERLVERQVDLQTHAWPQRHQHLRTGLSNLQQVVQLLAITFSPVKAVMSPCTSTRMNAFINSMKPAPARAQGTSTVLTP